MTASEFVARLGKIPACPEPEIREILREEFPAYTRIVVEYSAAFDQRLRSFLFLPRGIGKAPVVLALHPHLFRYDYGKGEVAGYIGDPELAYGMELAKRGYVVVCPDFLCFESRRSGAHVLPEMIYNSDDEMYQSSYLLAGGTSYNAVALSNIRSALLAAGKYPCADLSRVGVIGHEMGGQEAVWFGLYCREVCCVAASCPTALIADMMGQKLDLNLAAVYPDMLRTGDYDEIIAALSPTPLYLTYPEGEEQMPFVSYGKIASRVAGAYQQDKAEARLCSFPGKMAFPKALREEAYAFLDAHLKEKHDA